MNVVPWRLLLVLGALCLTSPGLRGAPRSTTRVPYEGRDYVRLSDWAASRNLEVRWLKRDESLQAANGSARVVLNVDSRQVEVNGIEVWLSFPVVQRGGAVYLARVDAQTTLGPLLHPPAGPAGARLKTICLDPGHGGKDPGYCVGSYQEKKYTLLLAEELRQQLSRAGFKVSLTRTSDRFIDLAERPELARRRRADLFISLHFNAAEASRGTVQGAQVFCLTPTGASSTNTRGEPGNTAGCVGNRNNEQNVFLAYELQKGLVRGVRAEDHGVRRARFAVLRDAPMPAVLIEAGFMSHPLEGRKIASSAYQKQLAQAITQGVLAFKQSVERGG